MIVSPNGLRVETELPPVDVFDLLRQSDEVTEMDRMILILKGSNETNSAISRVFRIHKGTVTKYVRRAQQRARRALTPPPPQNLPRNVARGRGSGAVSPSRGEPPSP